MGAVSARRGIYPVPGQARRVDNAPEAGRCRLVAGLGRKIASNLFCAGGEFRICLKPTLGNIDPPILVFFGDPNSNQYFQCIPNDSRGYKYPEKDRECTNYLAGEARALAVCDGYEEKTEQAYGAVDAYGPNRIINSHSVE